MDQITIAQHLECCTLLKTLAITGKRITRSQDDLARQREVVATLERDGGDSVSAREVLASFETVHALQVADLDRLVESLSKG
jgi:hypothetical protein